jgi:hypothetical protein
MPPSSREELGQAPMTTTVAGKTTILSQFHRLLPMNPVQLSGTR